MQDDKKEWLSALIDSQADLKDLDEVIASQENKDTWSRYHLIGDVMREQDCFIDMDLVSKIDAAIDAEPTIVSLAARRSLKERIMQSPILRQSSRFIGKSAQFAIAASVALVTVFSVQQYQQNIDEQSPLPVLLTTGAISGTIEPVSLSNDNAVSDERQKQLERIRQQQRIQALMIDHEKQLRINAQQGLEADNQ